MKKNFKTIFSFLLMLVFVFQFAGIEASAAPEDISGNEALGYQIFIPDENDDESTVDVTNEDDWKDTVIFNDINTLNDLISEEVKITAPADFYVSAVYLNDGNNGSTPLNYNGNVSDPNAEVTVFSEQFIDEDGNLNTELIPGDTLASQYTLIIEFDLLANIEDAIEVEYAAGEYTGSDALFGTAHDFSKAVSSLSDDTKTAAMAAGLEFAGWQLVLSNGAVSDFTEGATITKPYLSGQLVAQWNEVEPPVAPAPVDVSITANDATITEGDDYTFAPTISSTDISADDVSYSIQDQAEGTAVSSLSAGTYTIIPNCEVAGYNFTFVNGTLTVEAAQAIVPELTIKPKDVSVEYGTMASFELEFVDGTADISAITGTGYTLKNSANEDVTNSASLSVGSYTITITGATLDGHTLISQTGTLTVTAKKLSITANTPELSGNVYVEKGYTESGLVNGDTISSVQFDVDQTTRIATPKDAVIVNGATDVKSNYAIEYLASAAAEEEVPPARGEITIKANDRTVTYNGSEVKPDNYTVSSGSLASGDVIDSITYESGVTGIGSKDVKPASVVIKDKDGNVVTDEYDITFETGKVTVNKIDITISGETITKDWSEAGYKTSASDFKVEAGKLLSGHAVSGAPQIKQNNTVIATAKDAGDYALVLSNVKIIDRNNSDYDVSQYYNIILKEGKLTIKPSTTAIALTITADSKTWTYDGNAHKQESYTASGLVNGDKIDSVVFKSTSTITNAGTAKNEIQSVVIKDANGNAVPSGKYNITYKEGELKINKFAITLTAESASKAYDGKALVNKNVAASKLANTNHKLSVEFLVTNSSGKTTSAIEVGKYDKKITSYAIKDGTTDVTSNYDVKVVNGTLTITSSSSNNSNSPKTGDESNIGLWIGILLGSAVIVAGIIIFVVVKNKKKDSDPDGTTPPDDFDSNDDSDDNNGSDDDGTPKSYY